MSGLMVLPKFKFSSVLALFFLAIPGFAEEGHEHHEEDGLIRLEETSLKSLNLTAVALQKGSLDDLIVLPASVKFDPNRVAHLTPRVTGVAREIYYQLGDTVQKGDRLAVLDSREFGAAKSAWLAARARENLRLKTFHREKDLWEKQITSEQDYLQAQQLFEESRIETRIARQTLLALGVTPEILASLAENSDQPLTRYMITAPFSGTVAEQHISPGEVLKEDDRAFVLVDKSQVWVMARVFERDIRKLEPGRDVSVSLEAFPGEVFQGRLDYIGSSLDEETRTVEARVILHNPQGKFIAGMFGQVTVQKAANPNHANWLVPSSGVQRMKGGDVVFQWIGEGVFKPVPVRVINRTGDFVEISGPLQADDRITSGDIFILKSEAEKASMGEGHSH